MGLPTQKFTAITRDREIEIYKKKSVRKKQSRFSGCGRLDQLLCAITTKNICKYTWPEANFSSRNKSKKGLMGKVRIIFSGSGSISLTIRPRGLFEKKPFVLSVLSHMCMSCNEENVSFPHYMRDHKLLIFKIMCPEP